MIRTRLLTHDQQLMSGQEELIATWKENTDARLWLDIQTSDENRVDELLKEFGFHPLAIQDALRKRHPPKFEMFDDHVFILYRGILEVRDVLSFEHQQIAFFIGDNFVISLHSGNSMGVDAILKEQALEKWILNPIHIALKVMHRSAGIYLDSILQFETLLSELEDNLQIAGNDTMMAELVSYRSKLVKLRRIFSYHKSITESLKSPDILAEHNIEQQLHEIIDLHDRFERLHSLTQMHYEICGDLLEGYLSISSHQLNATMRVLTVITAVFVPLSFLAGLYGMNFEYIPELHWRFGYFTLLGTMALVAGCLMYFFHRKRWI
ncbi:Cobalt/magnesium transport protein CorA [Thalassocella blandensis]|nr:Cobalt/magnesium transport protein CorA [Thalassocella blandensis]